jgi:YHS domain-containing protein
MVNQVVLYYIYKLKKMKIMKLLFVCLAIFAFVVSCGKKQPTTASEGTVSPVSLSVDNDPVCHMSVKGIQADTSLYKGKVYGFCSDMCKGSFKKEPEKFLAQK